MVGTVNLKNIAYDYKIQFSSRNDQKMSRNCIVPVEVEEEELRTYFSKSTQIGEKNVRIQNNGLVTILDDLIDKERKTDSDFISSFWIDIVEYMVEVQQNDNYQEYLVIAGMETEEQDIKNVFQKENAEATVLVENYKDGWLKR